jgi:Fe2+ transport system protein FeoA
MEIPLSKLKKGQQARIVRLGEDVLSKRFLEVGITPGTDVTLSAVAPFGDPIAIYLGEFSISLRKKEAAQIFVVVLEN